MGASLSPRRRRLKAGCGLHSGAAGRLTSISGACEVARFQSESNSKRIQRNSLLMGKIQKKNDAAGSSAVIHAGGATGDLRLHEVRSRVFKNKRFLRVWLPPGYSDAENSGRYYPVLYLNDGQNLFEASA